MTDYRVVFDAPQSLTETPTHYCPGCTHGIAHRLVAEAIDQLDLRDRAIGIASVGCSVLAYEYFDCDMQQAAHGRAPAVATGIKRVLPDRIVFTYQGDGDLASIGTAEVMHAAMRGENITIIFINNAIYGMTGGQMAPTTLKGQNGRDPQAAGMPIRMSEAIATMDGATYVSRVSLHDARHVLQAKKSIQRAFEVQRDNLGFSLVEVLSTCPTNWGMTPVEALDWMRDNMVPYYPLGEFRTPEGATTT